MGENLPTTVPWTKQLISEIAMDIGKEVVHYIGIQYPKAIEATASTFKLAVRNCIHNEIMAAIEVNDEGQIIARMKDRKRLQGEIWKHLGHPFDIGTAQRRPLPLCPKSHGAI